MYFRVREGVCALLFAYECSHTSVRIWCVRSYLCERHISVCVRACMRARACLLGCVIVQTRARGISLRVCEIGCPYAFVLYLRARVRALQRTVSVLVYLSTCHGGGSTSFPLLGLRFRCHVSSSFAPACHCDCCPRSPEATRFACVMSCS